MGIGHVSRPPVKSPTALKQNPFFKVHHKHRYTHGGELRQKRAGRGVRPLACRESLHVVFKTNREMIKYGGLRSPKNFAIVHKVIRQYARRFFVKIESLAVNGDHIHALIRTNKRSQFHYFFRVVAGQIAQRLQQAELLHQPGKRAVRAQAQHT